MDKEAFLRGYLMKTAAEESLVPTPAVQAIPRNEEEAAILAQSGKDAKFKLRKELKELELQLSQLRAIKKQKELQLSTT
jgi:hypothetical protein